MKQNLGLDTKGNISATIWCFLVTALLITGVYLLTACIPATEEFGGTKTVNEAIQNSLTSTVNATPTVTPTSLPSLTPSKQASEDLANPTEATQQRPTATPFPSATASAALFQGPLIALVLHDPSPPRSLLVIDAGTGSVRSLQFDDGRPVRAGWVSGSCQLFVVLRTSFGVEVVETDLQASVIRTVYQYYRDDPAREPNSFYDGWAVSPSGEELAYMVYAGEHYYATSEYQDIEVIDLGDPSRSIRITKNGGALGFSWSPDGSQLAFSDYDADGVRQVYAINSNGESKRQLTRFSELGASGGEPRGNYVSKPVWSPDGLTIAFEEGIISEDGVFTSSLWTASITDGNQTPVVPASSARKYIMGWSEDGSSLAVYLVGSGGEARGRTLQWVDIDTGAILDSFESGRVPDSDVELLGAILGTRIWLGRDQDGRIYTYDAEHRSLEQLQDLTWPGPGIIMDLGKANRGEAVSSEQVIDWAFLSTYPSTIGACE
jgi:hypothetical protein